MAHKNICEVLSHPSLDAAIDEGVVGLCLEYLYPSTLFEHLQLAAGKRLGEFEAAAMAFDVLNADQTHA